MTDPIEELAYSAGVEWKTSPHFTNTDNPIDFPKDPNYALRKFAELLIQESVDWAFQNGDDVVYLYRHFGISK